MVARSPNGDLPMIAGFIVVRRRSTGAPTVTAEPPDDRRWGIGRKFGHFQWKSTGGRTVSRRRPGTRWLTLRHGSRSRKSGGELPISKNRHPAKIYRSPRDLYILGRRLNWQKCASYSCSLLYGMVSYTGIRSQMGEMFQYHFHYI